MLTHRGQVLEGFPGHFPVELLLGTIQQMPPFKGKGHSYILKGHRLLKYLKI
jgi:hypothetical protein